jgi:phosphohistidine phosphatase SixA
VRSQRRHTASGRSVTRRALLRLLALGGAITALTGAARGPVAPARAQAADPVWEALAAGGHVALIRHAEAPGVGDPADFVLEDCSTQRNLSGAGREQAVRIGETFRAHGVAVDQVLTSGWCRCIDTASLAFGTAEIWPPLHSFFRDSATERAQTREVRDSIAAWAGPGTLVLVTHQVNITALTDIFPASGEVIVLAPDRVGGFTIVGRALVG